MTTPASGLPTQTDIDEILRAYGIDPNAVVTLPPLNPDDPAMVAAAAARTKAAKDGKPVAQFIATHGDQLEQLFDRFDHLKNELDELDPKVTEVKDALKAALHHLADQAHKVQLFRQGRADGVALVAGTKTYINSDRLRSDFPDAYAACSYEKPHWELRRFGLRG
jgi:septal ring factor EnvC (AmiA/AmiB activator)